MNFLARTTSRQRIGSITTSFSFLDASMERCSRSITKRSSSTLSERVQKKKKTTIVSKLFEEIKSKSNHTTTERPILNDLKDRKKEKINEIIIYEYPNLVSARLVRRYKRFLANVILDDDPNQEEITIYCPNTGPMIGLLDEPNARIQISRDMGGKRKYEYTLEMIQIQYNGNLVWVGVHSALANKMVERALQLGAILELKMFPEVKREVKHVKNSRVDFVLSRKDENDVEHLKYVEVKSVTLATTTDCDNVCAVFPDTVSVRAQKHVKELTELIKKLPKTTSGAIIMLVQRNDCSQYAPSKVHDPEFARLCETASKEGVEIIAYSCSLEPPTSEKKGIVRLLPTPLEVVLQ